MCYNKIMSTPEIMALFQEISTFPMKTSFVFDVKGKKKTLSLEEVFLGAADRVGGQKLRNMFEKTKVYFQPGQSGYSWISIKNQSYEQLVANDFSCVIEDLGAHVAYKNVKEKSLATVAKDYNYTQAFLKWYMKKKGISEQQIVCDHDDTDQYTDDGNFYNSVGTCKKCLMETNMSLEGNEDLDLLFEAWNRK